MSVPIKKEILDWEPLIMGQEVSEKTKALIGKLSKLKGYRLTRIEGFDVWLVDIKRVLRSAGIEEGYLTNKGRAKGSRGAGADAWILVSKQVASWMKHHIDGTLIRVLRARGEALTFADTLIDKAKKTFGTGHLANQLRLKKFLAIRPEDFLSTSQFVTGYKEGFRLMRSNKIKMDPYAALLGMLLHIEQTNKQINDKIHYMLETEVDFAKSTMSKAQGFNADDIEMAQVVTVDMFYDFAGRTANLLELDEDL